MRRKRIHSGWKRATLVVLVVLLAGSYSAYAITQPLAALTPRPSLSFSRPARSTALAWPTYGESALGATGYGVLATHGASTPLPTASVAKIMTALCVLQEKPLLPGNDGPVITLTQEDVASYTKYVAMDGSVVHVAVGERLTEYEALEALLLPSANNIAETLARWAFGSVNAYTAYADIYASQLGMTATTITDPSGFLPTTVSSPRDLVVLGEAAIANPVIAGIVALPDATIPVQGTIRNVNVLLGQEGIVGIKTGNNDQDPGCFLFASTHTIGEQKIIIVGVIMDGPTLGTAMWDSLPLIRSAAQAFSVVTVARAGDPVGSYRVPWQSAVSATVQHDLTIVAWSGTTLTASLDLQTLQVPINTHATVGTLTVHADRIYSVPIVLEQRAEKPNILWRLTHPL